MTVTVRRTDDARELEAGAGSFLARRPVEHNLVATLVAERVAGSVPGRYWTVLNGGVVVGVVLQSPTGFPAVLTPMPPVAARAAAEAIAADSVALPGCHGDAATAAAFAGHWSEVTRTGALPTIGMRLHLLVRLSPPDGVAGALRRAGGDDLPLITEWADGFAADTGESAIDPDVLRRRVADGLFRLWTLQEPVAMAAHTLPVHGVARVHTVYTPPDRRGRGYAAACVAGLSAGLVAAGLRCVLYTDLGNPTSNGVYRRIGYRPVTEVLRYRFDG